MRSYAHMCRDEHIEIGHSDGEHERCPLCRANDRIAELEADIAELRKKQAREELTRIGQEWGDYK